MIPKFNCLLKAIEKHVIGGFLIYWSERGIFYFSTENWMCDVAPIENQG